MVQKGLQSGSERTTPKGLPVHAIRRDLAALKKAGLLVTGQRRGSIQAIIQKTETRSTNGTQAQETQEEKEAP